MCSIVFSFICIIWLFYSSGASVSVGEKVGGTGGRKGGGASLSAGVSAFRAEPGLYCVCK